MYGKILKNLRENRNLTQTELAHNIGLTQRMVSKYECEIVEMNFDTLIKFANFFDCSTDYILGREDDFGNVATSGVTLTAQEQRILTVYRALSERDKKTIENLFETLCPTGINDVRA